MKKLLLLLSATFTLAACNLNATDEQAVSQASSQVESKLENSVTINLNVEGEAVESSSVEIEENAILLEVMKDNFEVVEEGGFVSAINGYEQNEKDNLWWTFTVNEEMIEVGAAEYVLEKGDTVEWSLATFE